MAALPLKMWCSWIIGLEIVVYARSKMLDSKTMLRQNGVHNSIQKVFKKGVLYIKQIINKCHWVGHAQCKQTTECNPKTKG